MSKYHGIILKDGLNETIRYVERTETGITIGDHEAISGDGQGHSIDLDFEQIEPLIEALKALTEVSE